MTIHYQVHLPGGAALELDAAAINLGYRKLWFYDSRDNLLAVFRWESILGFTVKESAEGQFITEELLHERKQIEELENRRGPVVAVMERIHQTMQQAATELTSAHVKILDCAKTKSDTDVLRSKYGDDVRRRLAQLTEDQRALQDKLRSVCEYVGSVLARD
jgi:hypothetical protein